MLHDTTSPRPKLRLIKTESRTVKRHTFVQTDDSASSAVTTTDASRDALRWRALRLVWKSPGVDAEDIASALGIHLLEACRIVDDLCELGIVGPR